MQPYSSVHLKDDAVKLFSKGGQLSYLSSAFVGVVGASHPTPFACIPTLTRKLKAHSQRTQCMIIIHASAQQ